MAELFKCFLTGFVGFAALGLAGLATSFFWPYSVYVWFGLFICAMCVGLGSDLRRGSCGMGPR
jgi:hypothetical protein